MDFNIECPKLPWMVEFYSSTENGEVLNGQLRAAFADTTMEYLSALNVKSKTSPFRATQLVCTIPRHITVNTLEDLLYKGMSVARIVAATNTKEQIIEMLTKIRAVNMQFGRKIGRIYPLALALEIKGPEIRIGTLIDQNDEIFLPEGKPVTITTDHAYSNKVTDDLIYVDYEKLPEIIQPGDKLILANGPVRLSAIEAAESIIRCIVETAGNMISRDSVTVPNVPIEMPAICPEDVDVVNLAIEHNVDYIFVSGVNSRETIFEMRNILGSAGEKIGLIAKIENCYALENIDGIIKDADGICIDFEKLIFELPKEKLFLVQKSVLAKCNLEGKPAICSINICDITVLETSEVGDIANAIIDGADALMIPQKACTKDIMRDICLVCKEAEPAVHQRQLFRDLVNHVITPNEAIFSLCISAVESSLKSNAAAIVCVSTTGRTARILAQFRPRCPIITVTRYERTARTLRLYKGIEPIVYLKAYAGDWNKDVEERVQLAVTYGKQMDYIKMGDVVISVTGSDPQTGRPDSMRIMYASDYDTILQQSKYQPH